MIKNYRRLNGGVFLVLLIIAMASFVAFNLDNNSLTGAVIGLPVCQEITTCFNNSITTCTNSTVCEGNSSCRIEEVCVPEIKEVCSTEEVCEQLALVNLSLPNNSLAVNETIESINVSFGNITANKSEVVSVPNNVTLPEEPLKLVAPIITKQNVTEKILEVTDYNETQMKDINLILSKHLPDIKIISSGQSNYELSGENLGITIKSAKSSLDLFSEEREANIFISGVNENISIYYDDYVVEGYDLKTKLLAVNDIEIKEAIIQLPKSGNVDFILKCEEFSFDDLGCISWKVTDIPFVEETNYVEFIVDSFSGYAGGTTIQENNLVLLAPPILLNLILNTTSPSTNYTNTNLTAYWGVSDLESDPVKNITNWLVDGNSITVLNMPFEKINDTASNNAWDYSGSGNNGSENGNVVWDAGGGYDGGGAYNFPGSDDFINLTNDSSLNFGTKDFSIESRFYLPSLPSAWASIINKGASGNPGYGVEVSNTNQITCSLQGDGGTNQHIQGSVLSAGRWYHAVCVFDRDGQLSLYLDGMENAKAHYLEGNRNSVSTIYNFLIGRYTTGGFDFNGNIDEIRIYNRSLSPEQIKLLYENRTDIISFTETRTGENWTVDVTPNDNSSDGVKVRANQLIIPSIGIDNVSLNTTDYTLNNTFGNITTNYILTNGSRRGIINWYVNGTSLAVLNLPFEGNVNFSRVVDYSGYGNNGTINATYNRSDGHSRFGAYEFNGINESIVIPHNDVLSFTTGGMSISAWIKRSELGTGDPILDKYDGGLEEYVFGYVGGLLYFWVYDRSASAYIGRSAPEGGTAGSWQHVVATYDGGTTSSSVKIYINGSQADTTDFEAGTFVAMENKGGTVGIGRGNGGLGSDSFKGMIDEILVFNRTLSERQILTLYTNRTDLIHSNETAPGDIWQACVTPNDGFEDGARVCSENLTVQPVAVGDTTPPNITQLVPSLNSRYGVGSSLTISGIAVDNIGVDSVLVNVSFPNGSTHSIPLTVQAATDNYSVSFTPDQFGLYNITFIANDTSNNINGTEMTNFTVIDLTAPNISDLLPANNSVYNVSQKYFELSLNSTDNRFVSQALANISYPNGSSILYTLTNGTGYGKQYNLSFIIPGQIGFYNITFIVNDSADNKNYSTSVNFSITDNTPPNVTSLIPTLNTQYAFGTGITISGFVQDNVGVDSVLVNISFPNGSSHSITLAGFETFAGSLTLDQFGLYNITFIANDTSNNINGTEMTNFTVIDNVLPNITQLTPGLNSLFEKNTVINISTIVRDIAGIDTVLVNVSYPNNSYHSIYLLNSTDNNFTFTFSQTSQNGLYNLTFIVNDTSNNVNRTGFTNFTVTDTTKPNVTNLLPSANSLFNISDIIEIAANVTDNGIVGKVYANLSYPNNSVTLYELSNGTNHKTKFNLSFSAPQLVGSYNVTFIANDTSNNYNRTQKTGFIVTEVVLPNVTTILPALNSQFTGATTLEIAANVTDNVGVSKVYVNLTDPDGNQQTLELSNGTNHKTKFNVSYTANTAGLYNVTIVANDTSNNVNNTEKTNFTIVAATPTPSPSPSPSGGGGGGGGGGSKSTKKKEEVKEIEKTEEKTKEYECSEDRDCRETEFCQENRCEKRECTVNSDCSTNEYCVNYQCFEIFDLQLTDFPSTIEPDGDLEGKVLVLSKTGVEGDVHLEYRLELNEEVISSGSDVVFIGARGSADEKKEVGFKLSLPERRVSGDYQLYVKLSYNGYVVESHRTLFVTVDEEGRISLVGRNILQKIRELFSDFSLVALIVLFLALLFVTIYYGRSLYVRNKLLKRAERWPRIEKKIVVEEQQVRKKKKVVSHVTHRATTNTITHYGKFMIRLFAFLKKGFALVLNVPKQLISSLGNNVIEHAKKTHKVSTNFLNSFGEIIINSASFVVKMLYYGVVLLYRVPVILITKTGHLVIKLFRHSSGAVVKTAKYTHETSTSFLSSLGRIVINSTTFVSRKVLVVVTLVYRTPIVLITLTGYLIILIARKVFYGMKWIFKTIESSIIRLGNLIISLVAAILKSIKRFLFSLFNSHANLFTKIVNLLKPHADKNIIIENPLSLFIRKMLLFVFSLPGKVLSLILKFFLRLFSTLAKLFRKASVPLVTSKPTKDQELDDLKNFIKKNKKI